MEALMFLAVAIGIGAAVGVAVALSEKKAIRDAIREADIQRQIDSLRHSADHSVATRPRVRGNGYQPQFTPGTIKAPPRHPSESPKPCGNGLCRHRADCADHYCPGRLAAELRHFSTTTKGPTPS